MADHLTPKEIVEELDKYIVGQEEAKKCVAVALRNRYRRSKLPLEMQDEVTPKNIIMIGPTGVGKTEIARRLARLVKAPFVKVEATKFTEVGYVGRDVESIIRDLVEVAVRMVKNEQIMDVEEKARVLAEERIIDLLAPYPQKGKVQKNPFEFIFGTSVNNSTEDETNDYRQQELARIKEKRAILREKLKRQELEDELVEIEVEDTSPPMLEVFSGSGMEEMGINLQDILGGMLPKKKKRRRLRISEARKILTQVEADKLIDMDLVTSHGIRRAEQDGIIFLDEIDKIAGHEQSYGPDVSRGGVQRDILPIVEGSTVVTKYGPVKTDHMLFIAAGAFHMAKPSDLIPELQGRFPIRVELASLTREDFQQILTEPCNSLIKQYVALLATENIQVHFTREAIEEIARIAYDVNAQSENIGARRLHTILEKLLQDLFYEAPELSCRSITIDGAYVCSRLDHIVKNEDLS
ncbi:MAG TPA: ATP-dependent protease ATPase subunit HslU, partial [Clostridia bacterium]|nr:ATP-dependent protease ATPase subunit HslU [Clostridia bacterium]